MNRVTALLLCLCIAVPTAFAACPTQVAFDALGLGTLQTAAVITTPSYCPTSATVPSCCLAATINGLKTKSDAIQSTLENAFSGRDKALLDARRNIRALEANYTALKVALNASKTNINTWSSGSDATLAAAATKVKSFTTDFEDFFDKVLTGYNGIQSSWATYLSSRQTCMNKVLEVTANAKCYACLDANVGDVSATTGAVTFDTTTVPAAIVGACYNYLNASDYQNNILQLNPYNTSLTALTAAAVLMANGTSSAVSTFVTAMGTVASASKTYPAGIMPSTSCTSTSCDWITTNFLAGGLTGNDATKAAILLGGNSYTYLSRVLTGSESESRSRGLAMAANSVTSGVTPNFALNPSGLANNVDPSGMSAFRVGVVSSLVALFVAFLF